MNRIPFVIEPAVIRKAADAAYWAEGQHDPCEAIGVAVMESIGISIEVTAGGVTLHLAAWMDPEHWSDDWQAKGIEDGRAFIAGLGAPEEAPSGGSATR